MFANRCRLACGLLLLAPALASAQLRFIQPRADLGELRGGPVAQHRFEFVNASLMSIEIVDIRLGCGCLHPVLEKRTWQPGEKGALVMHLRTLGQPDGPRTWQASVLYRQGEKQSEADIVLAATIRNEVTVEPSILAMTIETTLKQEVTITDHRQPPAKVTAVLASSPAIRLTTLALGNGITKVTLEVSRTALTKARQEEMLNIYMDDPHYRQLQVPITLVQAIRDEVGATPEMVELIGPGSKLVRLRASGDRTVRIERIEAGVGIRCTYASGPGNDATLQISVDEAAIGATANVRVHLAEPTAAVLTIPVAVRKE